MKKSIEKPFFTPHPVLIIGTYDANGVPNAMNAAWGGQIGGSQISVSLGATHLTTANIFSFGDPPTKFSIFEIVR